MSTSASVLDESIHTAVRGRGRRPGRKVSAAALAGGISAVALWVIHLAGLNPTPEAASGITTLIVALTGYVVTERS